MCPALRRRLFVGIEINFKLTEMYACGFYLGLVNIPIFCVQHFGEFFIAYFKSKANYIAAVIFLFCDFRVIGIAQIGAERFKGMSVINKLVIAKNFP